MKLSTIVAAAICLLGPSVGSAQESLEVGDRVRVRVEGQRTPVVGWVTAIQEDSVELAVGRNASDSISIGTRDITEVERSIGTHRNTLQVGLTAGVLGAVAGAFAATTCQGCYAEWWSLGAILYGGPSLLFGLVIGSLLISEDWQEVAPLSPALSPGRGGGVDLTWSIR
jgi:hypothetical protein